jgi:hypothetical protein
MKHALFLAALLTLPLAAPAAADTAPTRAEIQEAVTQSGGIDSRARKYQGSQAGRR